jgi:hypothetical protein
MGCSFPADAFDLIMPTEVVKRWKGACGAASAAAAAA